MPRKVPASTNSLPDLGGLASPAFHEPEVLTGHCPRCFRTEAEMGPQSCGNFALSCPPPDRLPPEATVTIRCGPCNFTRTVPIANLVQGRRVSELRNCQHDECHCVRVL